MTSLYLVIKVHAESCSHDSQGKQLKLSSMIYLSRGLFSVENICRVEGNMLSTLLSWKQVNPITPYPFQPCRIGLCKSCWGSTFGDVGTRTTWLLGFPERAECGAASKVLLRLEAQGAWISILHVLSIVQQRSYDICRIFYSGLKSKNTVAVGPCCSNILWLATILYLLNTDIRCVESD